MLMQTGLLADATPSQAWRFETAHFVVVATIEQDYDVDISFDETSETLEKLQSGEWQAFATIVTVYAKASGAKLGSDALYGSIYAEPREFFTEHRCADPLNRNSSIMRAAHGESTAICHYFPEMVREAIRETRKSVVNLPRLRQTKGK